MNKIIYGSIFIPKSHHSSSQMNMVEKQWMKMENDSTDIFYDDIISFDNNCNLLFIWDLHKINLSFWFCRECIYVTNNLVNSKVAKPQKIKEFLCF